jgi:hypothetical protein
VNDNVALQKEDAYDPSCGTDYKNDPQGPLPRPQKKQRRVKEDRGLPPDDELTKTGVRIPKCAAQAVARNGHTEAVARD